MTTEIIESDTLLTAFPAEGIIIRGFDFTVDMSLLPPITNRATYAITIESGSRNITIRNGYQIGRAHV